MFPRHFPQNIIQRLLNNPPVQPPPGSQPGVQIQPRQQRIVIKHLLKMRHQPETIRRIPMKPAPNLIINAPAGHLLQCKLQHRKRPVIMPASVITQQNLQSHRLRKLRRRPHAPILVIKVGSQCVISMMQHAFVQNALPPRHPSRPSHLLRQLIRNPPDFRVTVTISLRHRFQQPRKPRHIMPVHRRKISPTIKRLALRSKKHRHRPPPAPRKHLHRLHINRIQIRPLLPVNLNVDKMPVHNPRDRLILKRLPLHHMTPMASRIPDTKQYRLILQPRPPQSLLPPRIPIHRIVSVLQQIRTRLMNQPVSHNQPPSKTNFPTHPSQPTSNQPQPPQIPFRPLDSAKYGQQGFSRQRFAACMIMDKSTSPIGMPVNKCAGPSSPLQIETIPLQHPYQLPNRRITQ